MKKTLLFLLLVFSFNGFGQMDLTNFCGNTIFDLTVNTPILLVGNPPSTAVTYYETNLDANEGLNFIAFPSSFVTPSTMVIYARVEDASNGSFTIASFNLIVNPSISVGINVTLDEPSSMAMANVFGGQEPYTYKWSMDGVDLVGETTEAIYLLDLSPGTLTVTVTDANGCLGQSSLTIFGPPAEPLSLTKTGVFNDANDDGMVSIGDTITYTFRIANYSTEPYTNLSIQDTMISPNPIIVSPTILYPGELTVVTAQYPIVQNDIDMESVTNSATVFATNLLGNTISDVSNNGNSWDGQNSPTITPLTIQPELTFIKTAMVLSDNAGTMPVMIAYTFTVTNTGNVTINNCMINDVLTGTFSLIIAPSTLSPGQTGVASMTYMVTPNDLSNGFVINSASVSGTTSSGDVVTDVSDEGNPANGNDTPTVTQLPFQQPMLVFSMEGNYEDYNNDGYTNVGDVVNYSFSIQNAGFVEAYDILISTFSMTTNGDPIPVLLPGETDSTTFNAVHVITQQDINNGYVQEMAMGYYSGPGSIGFVMYFESGVNLNINDGIQLNAFIDFNSNSVKDINEPNFPYGNFHYESNADGIEHNVMSPSGLLYLYESDPTAAYSLSYELNAEEGTCGAQYAISTSSYNNVTVPAGSGITTYSFPVTVIPCSDLEVFIYGDPPRPGFTYYNTIVYTNRGNQPIASGTITFNKNSTVSIIATSPSVTSNVNGFTYDFTNLAPLETRYIYVSMQVPTIPTVTLGQVLTNSTSTTIPAGDINVSNNEFQLSQTIIGSYDPNDKNEAHGPQIVYSGFTAEDYLTYTIRFENTGTADAINVLITDALDEKLDETSVRTIAASGNYVMERAGLNLTWKFDGLNLPPSVEDTQIGHGYVVFQVKPKADYELGDVIPNDASIYFDFNPAIVTNTFTTEFVIQLGTDDFANNDFVFYPNPVKDVLNISNAVQFDAVTVFNLLGQAVITKSTHGTNTVIDCSSLQSGIYMVKITAQESEKTIRIIKE